MSNDYTPIHQAIDLLKGFVNQPTTPAPAPEPVPAEHAITSQSVKHIEVCSSIKELPPGTENENETVIYFVPLVGIVVWDAQNETYRNFITGDDLTPKITPIPEPVPEPTQPAPKPRPVVSIYNGTNDGADETFYKALGDALGAGVSYYTPNAKVKGQYAIRSWDLKRIERGYVPVIHLQSVAYHSGLKTEVQYYPWKHVAEGKHDADFISMAKALAGTPEGTVFAFDGEPEVRLEKDSHQPVPNPNTTKVWPEGWPQNGDGLNTPAYYVAAQRRIFEIIKTHAPHIDFRFWFAGHDRGDHMRSFYPGAEYVDSIGIDPYVWAHNPASTTPLQKYKPIVDWVRAQTSWGQKPIGISETGIDTKHGDAAGEAFWKAMPEAVAKLDLSWVTLYNRSQWQITPTTFPRSWAAYVEAMKNIAGK